MGWEGEGRIVGKKSKKKVTLMEGQKTDAPKKKKKRNPTTPSGKR